MGHKEFTNSFPRNMAFQMFYPRGIAFSRYPRRITLAVLVVFLTWYYCFFSSSFGADFRAYPQRMYVNFADPEDVDIKYKNFSYQNRTRDDPELISYIGKILQPPSTNPYNLSHPELRLTGPGDETALVEKLFGQVKRDGFFVEVGAFNGESWSITMYLERYLGFKGLLIEANPVNYQVLLTKERKAYSINAALSPTNTSGDLLFSGSLATGVLVGNAASSSGSIKVKSFPLYSILQSINVTFVDYFSLDIQGFEFKVLKTIPWDKLKMGCLVVEYTLDPEPRADIVKYMENLGYVKVYQNSEDFFFCDPEYYQKIK